MSCTLKFERVLHNTFREKYSRCALEKMRKIQIAAESRAEKYLPSRSTLHSLVRCRIMSEKISQPKYDEARTHEAAGHEFGGQF